MARKTLRDVLDPEQEDSGTLRWRATVPMATNPFLLIEWCQFGLAGGGLVLLTLSVGVRFTDGVLTMADIIICLRAAVAVLLGIVAAFLAVSALLFGNRYYALYHMDAGGIYHESSRGQDESGTRFFLDLRPGPVQGAVTAARTSSRVLPWEKVRSFQNIPSMRVIVLRRGLWHMMRVYTPDAETHQRVAAYLTQRLQAKRPE